MFNSSETKFVSVCAKIVLSLALLFFVLAPLCYASPAGRHNYGHYESILKRAPFGLLPPKPEAETAAKAEPAEQQPPEPEIPPPGLESVRITMLTRFNGKPAVGFSDSSTGLQCYLQEGQTWEDFTLVSVDFENTRATLRRGSVEAVLPLWINPSTTNCADLATFGMTPGAVAKAAAAAGILAKLPTQSPSPADAAANAKLTEIEKRRAEWRAARDEERRKRREELAKMTPEEREQRLRKINVEIIKTGSGPPLPIELNEDDMQELANAGFEVPGVNVPETAPDAGDVQSRRVRPDEDRGNGD